MPSLDVWFLITVLVRIVTRERVIVNMMHVCAVDAFSVPLRVRVLAAQQRSVQTHSFKAFVKSIVSRMGSAQTNVLVTRSNNARKEYCLAKAVAKPWTTPTDGTIGLDDDFVANQGHRHGRRAVVRVRAKRAQR